MAATVPGRMIVTERMAKIRRVLWIVLFLNLAVALAKYVWGVLSGSASMQADGIHSVFDSAGNVVGLIGITFASRPADEGHPYGHAKFETYASLAIGVLLLVAAFEVGSSALSNLINGTHDAEVTVVSFVVMVLTLAVNVCVSFYERKQSEILKSAVLGADSRHTLSDALVSVGVIIGLVLVSLGIQAADAVMALLVTVAILFSAFEVFKSAFATLSDRARIPEDQIRDIAVSIDGVRDAHKIRTRGTEGEVYVDLHLLVDPDMSVKRAHDLADVVEARMRERFEEVCEVLIHIEPDDGHREAHDDSSK